MTRIRDAIRQAPYWVDLQQSGVILWGFYGNLEASRINNLPSGGAGIGQRLRINRHGFLQHKVE